jgi:hypothetical protein
MAFSGVPTLALAATLSAAAALDLGLALALVAVVASGGRAVSFFFDL